MEASWRYLPSESICSNVVPKLVAMATSLTPSISSMSSLDSLFPKTHPYKIKQRIASSYHITEVIAHRKPKRGCHGNVPQLQGIGNICILSADHSNPLHNQSPSRYRSQKASYSNFSPKIGCHANVQLDPRSRLSLHWIAWPRKPTPRIKQRVPSCHTTEVNIDSKLTCPTPHTKGTADLRDGWWDTHHVWYGRPHIAADWSYCFRFPDFPRIREWRSSKCRFWVRKSAKMGDFRPSIF